jgi:hypothetical protein
MIKFNAIYFTDLLFVYPPHIPLTSSLLFPILNLYPINHNGYAMHQKIISIKYFLILCL